MSDIDKLQELREELAVARQIIIDQQRELERLRAALRLTPNQRAVRQKGTTS